MTYTVSFASQKGGVGKSTLSRSLAAEAIKAKLRPFLADMDIQQTTSAEWSALRDQLEQAPSTPSVEARSVKEALNMSKDHDLLIMDGRPHASAQSVEMAQVSDLIVIPTSDSYDDLKPSVALAHALSDAGVDDSKIRFALTMTSTDAEAATAREWLASTGYAVLPHHLKFRPVWRQCAKEGTALTETRFKSVNKSAKPFFAALIKEIKK